MNKTDRLLAIVLELQRRGTLRAEDLAATFETSVRTIYRDMQSLSEANVPVIGSPGTGYSLMDGYFLPPVSFAAEEAVTLLMGAHFVEQKFDPHYQAHAQTSRAKIEAILPGHVRSEAARILSTVRLLATGRDHDHSRDEKERIEALRQAMLHTKKVQFRYTKKAPEPDGNRESFRVVAPYGLVLVHGSWILIAQCDLRQEIRHFRLSRMSELQVIAETYEYPADFRLQDYQPADDRHVYVRMLAKRGIVDRVKEANHFYLDTMEEHPDGLLMTFRVRYPEELLEWILGWGANVVVLEPESLRGRIREEAEKMLGHY
ncbi:helix-turn-helix transcriptional regulator [Brevibacillus dissolubilis]|uniref:helix-turn-helix transcriptional regulator n=1 Tax=Brevibacillus dissolubilis TaxID=1844116 RepID=UPI00111600CB|nr:YafY family protein [Brevibacillus dissolubilis]